MFLAGDIGGTKTLMGLYECEDKKLNEIITKRYSSQAFSSLEEIIDLFLKENNVKVDKACFGVPGPVVNGSVKSTNLPWTMDEKVIAEKLSITKVKLVNDLVAMSSAVPYFSESDLITLYEGKEGTRTDVFVVLAPGTGLGQATIIKFDDKFHVLPSEAGHVDFAPLDDIQIELLKYLRKKFGRVSIERVASGEGIVNIFNYLVDTGYEKVSEKIIEKMSNEDHAAVISEAAINKSDKLCEKALDIFTQVLGSHAGNLVLTTIATGGVYLGGGIPTKILPKLTDGTFVSAFLN